MEAYPPGASILVIDDNPTSRNTIRDYLTRAHFHVCTAVTGWEALKRLKDGQVDAVIMASSVPDTDGSALREKFMLNPASREVPFIYLAESGAAEAEIRALRNGVDDCIEKPFDPVVLVARVQATLERRQGFLRMMRTDPLTRLLNRQLFQERLDEELQRMRRYKRQGALIVIDMDGFGALNQKHGVEMGDLLMTCLGGIVLTNLRASDMAGRLSADKVALYLPETDVAGARVLTERMRDQVGRVGDDVAGIPLSFCAGLVEAPGHGETSSVLINRAFETVRDAKKRGTGQVAEAPMPAPA